MEIQESIRCTIMRGGTSKGVFLHRNDLPRDPALRDRVIMRIFGAPDPREIDGIGGAELLTSKVAVVGPPTRPDSWPSWKNRCRTRQITLTLSGRSRCGTRLRT